MAWPYFDAAKEGAAVPGLGGFLHGFWWSYALSTAHLELPITALEFVTIDVGLEIFEPMLAGFAIITPASDSLPSVLVLSEDQSRSPLL